MSRKTNFYAFGTNIYSYGLVHIGTGYDEMRCGGPAQHGPPLTVHDDEPVTCFKCITAEIKCGTQG